MLKVVNTGSDPETEPEYDPDWNIIPLYFEPVNDELIAKTVLLTTANNKLELNTVFTLVFKLSKALADTEPVAK